MQLYVLFLLFLSVTLLSHSSSLAALKNSPQADLVVKKVSITKTYTDEAGHQHMKISYTISNEGKALAPASKLKMTKNNKDAIIRETPPLKPGESDTTTLNYEVTKEGNYQFKFSADYQNRIPENNNANNENTLYFGIGRAIGP